MLASIINAIPKKKSPTPELRRNINIGSNTNIKIKWWIVVAINEMFWYIFFTSPVENIIWWFVEKKCKCVLIPDKLTEKICVVPNRFLFYEGFPEAEITRVWSLPSSLIMLHSRHQGWRKLKLKWLSGTSDIRDTGRNSNAWHTRPRSKLLLKWIF